MFKYMFLLSSLCLITSCSSLSGQDCLNANWYQKGMTDAKAGKPKSTLGNYKNDCGRNGIQFDSEEYIEGYEKGLSSK